jgi:hypothetical protein
MTDIVGYVDPSGDTSRNWVRIPTETRIRPIAPDFTAGEIARRADPAGYGQGVAAGHEDALAHLDPLIWDLWSDLSIYRRLRDRSHREHADFRVYSGLVKAFRPVLCNALAIRRALKEGIR